MARGGQHGDKRRLEEFLQSTEEWGNADARALSADAVTSESEMEESDNEEAEDDSVQGGAAGARMSSPQAEAASDAGTSSSMRNGVGSFWSPRSWASWHACRSVRTERAARSAWTDSHDKQVTVQPGILAQFELIS
jgi:hypothetical protein